MSDNRELRHGEKRLGMFSSEKGRDRAQAQRSIEGLNQNDQIIFLLTRISEQLQWVTEEMARRRPSG